MLRLLLLAACAAPAAALPFGFGRRKGEVLASLHGPGLTAQTTAVQTNPVPAVDTSSTGVQTGGALVSDTV